MLTNAITPDRIGGLERYVRELSDALARAGADVMVLTRRLSAEHPARERAASGVTIARYRTPSKRHPAYALGYPAAALRACTAAVAREGGARIVHSHFPLQALAAAAARRPFVHTFHAPVHREVLVEHQGSYRLPAATRGPLRQTVRAVERAVVKRPQALVTLSRFMTVQAAALGARPDTLRQIPGGVDTDRFSPGPPLPDRGPGPLLFTARRLVPRTGVAELVSAMAQVSRALPSARLAIAGHGPLEASIRAQIAQLGLSDRVRLLGWIDEAELVGWLRTADLAVMPTQELEGFGLATAEALACGTPVVGTPAGATPELLSRLDASLLARDPSPGALAAALLRALQQPGRVRELAARARAVVHPSMSWAHVADEHLALYEQLGAQWLSNAQP